jgi:MFS family permease
LTAELARLILGHVCACMPAWPARAWLRRCGLCAQGYSPVAVGVLLALFALTQVFLALPAGRYADRHGLRRPVAWVLVACAGAALAVALVPSFATLCVPHC